MAAAGALGQLGVQSIGQSIGYGISKAQLGDSYNIWKKSLKRGPTYRVIGLKRAGLNPILAAGGGVSATNAGALMKANQASGSPGSGNPALAQSQSTLLDKQTEIATAQLVYEQGKANLYGTEYGKNLIQMEALMRALPDNPTAAAIKAMGGLGNWLMTTGKDLYNNSNQSQKDKLNLRRTIPVPVNLVPPRERNR